MKKFKRVNAVLVAATLAAVAVFASGCHAATAKMLFDGVWYLNIGLCDQSDEIAGAIKYAALTVSHQSVVVDIEFTDAVESCRVESGVYEIDSFSCYSPDTLYISCGKGPYYNPEDDGYYWKYFNMRLQDGVLCIENCATDFKDGRWNSYALCFSKEETDYTPPEGGSVVRFSDIKTAYADAGYTVDVGEGELGKETAALVEQMKTMYAAMGCEISVIGKNVSDANITDTELYMLFGAPTESDAREIESALGGVYDCARSGRYVMVYIWQFGSANFEPFETATRN